MITPEQKAIRHTGIGGSDAGGVYGVSTYKTNVELYFEKINGAKKDGDTDYPSISNGNLSKNMAQHIQTKIGNLLEPEVMEIYKNETGIDVVKDPNTIWHPHHKFMFAHIDGRMPTDKNRVWECKTTLFNEEYGEEGTDEMPPEVVLQCAHIASVCDVERVDVAVLFFLTKKFKIYHYFRNERLEKKMIEKEKIFWHEHVQRRVPPEPKTYHDALLVYKKEIEEKMTVATPEIEEIYGRYVALNRELKEKNKELKKIKDDIACFMQDAESLWTTDGRNIGTWRTQNRKAYEVPSTSMRVLRIKDSIF